MAFFPQNGWSSSQPSWGGECHEVSMVLSGQVASLIVYDRVIFKGHLPLSSPRELERFVDYVLKIRRKDFLKKLAPQYSEELVEHAKGWAHRAKRIFLYRTGKFRRTHGAASGVEARGGL
jgi:hypothetical protein